MTHQQFTQKVIKWFDRNGRKNLPWQQNISAYRVWISEIMLQQTQVQTVVPYFDRFIKRFPTVISLANAQEDEVLHLWTGLGYYARARNLHRTAKIIHQQFNDQFPSDLNTLQSLPGIGRSTAGAILSLAMQISAPILDGNVKRVLARTHAINGYPGLSEVAEQLWQLSELYTPQKKASVYNQAMMDIGAMICTRTQPQCQKCPLRTICIAYQHDQIAAFPGKKTNKPLPVKSQQLLILCNRQGDVLLEKRPAKGIWGGLWSLPECPEHENIKSWCWQNYRCRVDRLHLWPMFRHTFTHFHLDIVPVLASIKNVQKNEQADKLIWYNVKQPDVRGLAAPVKKILNQVAELI